MAKDELFRKLCTKPVLSIGWHLAHADSADDFATDPFGYADFGSHLDDRLHHLCQEVRSYRYRPRHLLGIDIPKSGLSVRPGNVLPVEESLLLHAIMYLLAQRLDSKLSPNVYSFRLHRDWQKRAKRGESLFKEGDEEIPFLKHKTVRKLDPFEAWYAAWPDFDKQTARAVHEFGCKFLTKTDISAYFENIDLRILETQLRSLLRRDEDAIFEILFRILDGWTRVTTTGTPIGRGIPQGEDVGRFLGNLYLIPLDAALDQFCRRHGGHWCRYMDDVKVMTKTEAQARESVFLINNVLRQLHLNLQGSKTRILTGEELDAEIYDPDGELVAGVIDEVQKLLPLTRSNSKQVTGELKKLSPLLPRFRKKSGKAVSQLDGDGSRLFRRMMTAYGMAARPHLIYPAFEALRQLPDLRILNKSLRYLTQQPVDRHDEITERLLKLIEDDGLLFPYQVAVVLDTFRHLHPASPWSVASRIRRYALDRKRFWYVQQKAGEAISYFPYREEYAATVAERLLGDEHPWVRRAGCLLLVRAPVEVVRNRVQKLICHPDHRLSRAALYWNRFITDPQFADQTLARFTKGNQNDRSFVFYIPAFYAIRCSPEPSIVARLSRTAAAFIASRSAKVRWHAEMLVEQCAWATQEHEAVAISA